MSLFTKRAIDIYNPVDGSGNPRGADMGDCQIHGTEVEQAIESAISTMVRVRLIDVGGGSPATAYAAGQTIDGKTIAANDLILRATPGGNVSDGVYPAPVSGAASRLTAFNTYDSMPGCYFSVMEGTAYADTLWHCTSDEGGTLGTTALVFSQFTSGAADGWVSLRYNATTWVCTGPNGGAIDLTSAGSDVAAMIQIGINYAQTNGYNFSMSGPSVDSAGGAHVAACASTITIGPSSNKIYDIRLGTLQWSNFNSQCFNIKTLSGCKINIDANIEHSTSADATAGTIMFSSGSVEPRYGGTIYQHCDFYCRSITAFGTHHVGYAYLFNFIDPNYQIIQSRFYLGAVDGGPVQGYTNCILFNNPSTTGGAIGDCRFEWSRFVGWSVVGVRVGITAFTTELISTNYFSGAMENTKTGGQSFIDSYGSWDTWCLTSIDTNTGTAGDGLVIRGSDNNIRCPWIVCSGTGVIFASGANKNVAVFNNAPGATADISDSGTANTYIVNGVATGLAAAATNSNAAAGHLGEYVTSLVAGGSAVSLTTATAKTITSISLTPGDWDIHGFIIFNPAGTTTISRCIATFNSTTNALPSTADEGYHDVQASFTTGASQSIPIGSARVSIATTTTYYLIGYSVFGVSTMTAYGRISARRAR